MKATCLSSDRSVKLRLEGELEKNQAISERQYGFRAGRSTIQAADWVVRNVKASDKWCLFVALDIKNAFNTASWGLILNKLGKMGISAYLRKVIANYLSERVVTVEGEQLRLTGGVPQGSVLGPTPWNILYNDVLELKLPEGCQTIAFADDLGLLVTSKTDTQLTRATNQALDTINEWMDTNKLSLAPTKTEAVILKGPRKRTGVAISLAGVQIVPSKSLKYLGIHFDVQMNFGVHVRETAVKADKAMARLGRIMPNIGGASSPKRALLYGVMESILLYGAPVWSGMVERIPAYRAILIKSQRRGLMRVVSSYRTVSAEALQVIAGIPTIDLLAKERRLLYESGQGHLPQIKKEEREKTIEEWQSRWNSLEDKAQWTKALIPNLREWVHCKHRSVSFHLTQFLSGHGAFRKFTYKIKKTRDDKCLYCGSEDSPEHTIFICPRWQTLRRELHDDIGTSLSTQNIIGMMITNEERYWRIRKYVEQVMSYKEIEERAKERGEIIF